MIKYCLILGTLLSTALLANAQATVRVEPEHLNGPRELQDITRSAVIRDYLKAWQGLRTAMDENRPELLSADFVGTSRDKLAETIQQQRTIGIKTKYQDISHDIQIVFYSPEGLSVELTDNVVYDMQVTDHDKVTGTQRVTARYVAVLTPAEIRWRVRVFQAVPN
jgi:hypothetical protein